MRAVARLAACSSSSSPAATSPTSSTAVCATSRPRTSRTSWPCCAWPTTRPTASRGFAGCSCSTASGRRRRGRVLEALEPDAGAPARRARALAGRAGRAPTEARGPARRRRRGAWAPPRRAPRPACAPRGCATRSAPIVEAHYPDGAVRLLDLDALVAAAGQSPDLAPLRRRPRPRSARLELGPGRARQPRRGLARAQHRALGEGPGVALGPRARALRRQLPLRPGGGRPRGDRGGAAAALRRAHPRPARPAPLRARCATTTARAAPTTATATARRRASSPRRSRRCAGAPTAPGLDVDPTARSSRHGRARASRCRSTRCSAERRRVYARAMAEVALPAPGAAAEAPRAPGLPDRAAARAAHRGRRARRSDRGDRRQQALGAGVLPRRRGRAVDLDRPVPRPRARPDPRASDDPGARRDDDPADAEGPAHHAHARHRDARVGLAARAATWERSTATTPTTAGSSPPTSSSGSWP